MNPTPQEMRNVIRNIRPEEWPSELMSAVYGLHLLRKLIDSNEIIDPEGVLFSFTDKGTKELRAVLDSGFKPTVVQFLDSMTGILDALIKIHRKV